MKLKYNFIINDVADKKVAVAVGGDLDQFNGFIKMNDIGAEIFEILKDDVTLDGIIDKMCEKHPESTRDEAAEAVGGFVAELEKSGLII